jgi:predicted CoA-binding protein
VQAGGAAAGAATHDREATAGSTVGEHDEDMHMSAPDASDPAPTGGQDHRPGTGPDHRPGTGQYPGQNLGTILSILQRYRRVAMVGLSANPNRPSYFAATYLRDYGYELYPVNPAYTGQEILRSTVYASLADVPGPLEVVDIFRKPEDVPPIVDEAIRLGAKVIWMQLGVIHHEARQKALDAGLEVVMDRCMKIEHARFHGGLNFAGIRTNLVTARKPRMHLLP